MAVMRLLLFAAARADKPAVDARGLQAQFVKQLVMMQALDGEDF